MRGVIALLLLLCAALAWPQSVARRGAGIADAGGGGGSPSVSAGTCADSHGATSDDISCSFSANPTAGGAVVVFVSYYDFASSTLTCSDNQSGNTYTPPTNSTATASGFLKLKSFVATGVNSSGTFTITCHYGGGATYEQIVAKEVVGGTSVDQSAVSTAGDATVMVGPVTTIAAAAVLMGVINDTAGLTFTAGNICGVASTDGGGTAKGDPPIAGLRVEYKDFASSQSACSAVMGVNNSSNWAGALVAIK